MPYPMSKRSLNPEVLGALSPEDFRALLADSSLSINAIAARMGIEPRNLRRYYDGTRDGVPRIIEYAARWVISREYSEPSSSGEALRAMTYSAGFSQNVFRRLLGIDPKTMSMYVNDKPRPPLLVMNAAHWIIAAGIKPTKEVETKAKPTTSAKSKTKAKSSVKRRKRRT